MLQGGSVNWSPTKLSIGVMFLLTGAPRHFLWPEYYYYDPTFLDTQIFPPQILRHNFFNNNSPSVKKNVVQKKERFCQSKKGMNLQIQPLEEINKKINSQ